MLLVLGEAATSRRCHRALPYASGTQVCGLVGVAAPYLGDTRRLVGL